ncbi:hypothetical protein CLV30_110163 [Haloactinopolyspora alba]|uniref:Uncharacterized protein n=1 Tax=Haloactinopolyspora alba TaxID=648780 RepID=A0A2P8DZ79_9ACTN|nr:hypothetical protein CLV30_110163 [Haloactinopolyspora alba]
MDVDDLVALAIALGVSPPALLMPSESTGDGVELTPSRSASTQAAWRWATGEQPLIEPGQLLYQLSSEVAEFRRQNRPYEGSRVDEATRTLITGNDQLAPAAAMRAEITVYVTSDGEVVGRPPRVSYFAAGDLFVDEDQEPDRGDD